MSERYDVVVFGATGFTGKYAIKSCFKLLKNHKWAIAGRNQQKLQDTLKEVGEKIGQNLSNIPIIIADVKDEKSLLDMAKQAKVVVNTCGPYRHFGEAVVKACIEASASHVDVSGEPQYMETMQLKYHEMAREKGIYIVSACGFDSIPADFGTVHMQREFGGTVNSVESFITFRYLDNYQPTGASVNYGTYESVIWGVAHNNELRGIRNQLYKNKLPKFTPTLKARSFIHKQPLAGNKYCIPFMGSDKSVVYRSQRHFFEHDNQRPVQMMPYIAIGNIFHISIAILMGIIFGFLTRFNFGINLLLNHPKFFTLGAATREGKENHSIFTHQKSFLNDLLAHFLKILRIKCGSYKLCAHTNFFSLVAILEIINPNF